MLPENSASDPEKACSEDNMYYYMPFNETKPCLFVCAMFEDLRKRMFHTNLIDRIVEKLVGK